MAQTATPDKSTMPETEGPRAPPEEAYQYTPNHVSTTSLRLRQLSSIALIVLLYSAAVPFTPFSWIASLEGTYLLDRLSGGIVILCACYFQWRIASSTSIVMIELPGPERTILREGRLETSSAGSAVMAWQPSNYWPYAMCEFLLLCVCEFEPFGSNEMMRRGVVGAILAALWVVGYAATPEATRNWAWGHIKGMLFWMILDELFGFGRSGTGFVGVPGGSKRRMRNIRGY